MGENKEQRKLGKKFDVYTGYKHLHLYNKKNMNQSLKKLKKTDFWVFLYLQ